MRVGSLPARVNHIREVECVRQGQKEGERESRRLSMERLLGSLHFVRKHKKEEDDEEGEGEGVAGECKGACVGEEWLRTSTTESGKWRGRGRARHRKSLEYDELEAVRARLHQATCMWKGHADDSCLESPKNLGDGFHAEDEDEDDAAVQKAVMAEMQRKGCPMKLPVTVSGRERIMFRKSFHKWFGKVKSRVASTPSPQ